LSEMLVGPVFPAGEGSENASWDERGLVGQIYNWDFVVKQLMV